MIDKNSDNWRQLPFWLKCWFGFTYLQIRPNRAASKRVEILSHVSGFIFCALGLVSEAALVGGLLMLANAYLFTVMAWQGDRYGIWYDAAEAKI